MSLDVCWQPDQKCLGGGGVKKPGKTEKQEVFLLARVGLLQGGGGYKKAASTISIVDAQTAANSADKDSQLRPAALMSPSLVGFYHQLHCCCICHFAPEAAAAAAADDDDDEDNVAHSFIFSPL